MEGLIFENLRLLTPLQILHSILTSVSEKNYAARGENNFGRIPL